MVRADRRGVFNPDEHTGSSIILEVFETRHCEAPGQAEIQVSPGKGNQRGELARDEVLDTLQSKVV